MSLSKKFLGTGICLLPYTPWKFNMEPENTCLKRKLIFQTFIFGFHGFLSTTLSNALKKSQAISSSKAIKHPTVQAMGRHLANWVSPTVRHSMASRSPGASSKSDVFNNNPTDGNICFRGVSWAPDPVVSRIK